METLEEVVESSGWVLYAWVLMSNHYHFLFKTPEPNLVQGMSWFQNTWTRRFNARHRYWGHLFGGRYKAKPVEEGFNLCAYGLKEYCEQLHAGRHRSRTDELPH